MRIVFLVPGFPAHAEDTTCLPAVQQYIRALAERHPAWDVQVFASQYPFVRSSYVVGRVQVHALNGQNRSRPFQLQLWARALRHMRRLHRQRPIDVVHSFWLGSHTLAGQWFCKQHQTRHVASIGGQEVRAPHPFFVWIRWPGLTLTAGSAFAAETFRQHGGPVVDAVVPLGLDVQQLAVLPRPADRDVDLIGVGSLSAVKQYDQFLDVVAAVKQHRPDLRVVLVGEGYLRPALERQIEQLGLAPHVTLTGLLPRPEALAWMLRAKVFLHPAVYEAQGYVFLEALYAGLDVVSRAVGFRGDSDRVWTCATTTEMADTVLQLLDQKRPHTPVVPFTVDQTVDAFTTLYGSGVAP